MKLGILALLLAFSTCVFAEERIYLSLDNLSFTEEGIFFKKGKCTLQLPSIAYDEFGYYLALGRETGVTILRCEACGFYTWWVEGDCCLEEECPYYCY